MSTYGDTERGRVTLPASEKRFQDKRFEGVFLQGKASAVAAGDVACGSPKYTSLKFISEGALTINSGCIMDLRWPNLVWQGDCYRGLNTDGPQAISAITVDAAGSGYEAGDALTFTGGGGSGAAAEVQNVAGPSGAINVIRITNTGDGYSSAPTVGVTSGGSSATFTATVPSSPYDPPENNDWGIYTLKVFYDKCGRGWTGIIEPLNTQSIMGTAPDGTNVFDVASAEGAYHFRGGGVIQWSTTADDIATLKAFDVHPIDVDLLDSNNFAASDPELNNISGNLKIYTP